MSSNTDPFEEFEFKPLTDGLGFHKKARSLKEDLKTSSVVEDELVSVPNRIPQSFLEEPPQRVNKKHSFEDVLSALEKTPLRRPTGDLQITEILPREIERPKPNQSPFPSSDVYRNPEPNKPVAKTEISQSVSAATRRGAADSRVALSPAPVYLPATLLDLVIVSSLTLLFLIGLLTVTQVDLSVVTAGLKSEILTQLSFAVLVVSLMQMYVLVSRYLFGCTVGEWTFDLQLGQPDEQKAPFYAFKVLWRCVLNTLTGLVLLPLLSAVLGWDVAGRLSGIQLYRSQA